jgi:hypothetical protein
MLCLCVVMAGTGIGTPTMDGHVDQSGVTSARSGGLLMTDKQRDCGLLDQGKWPNLDALCHEAKDRPVPDESPDRAGGQNAPEGGWSWTRGQVT